MNFYNTAEIDTIVQSGRIIGNCTQFENIPHQVGDWSIRPITKKGDVIIVAIPTNARTRVLYNEGRKAWLKSLGYSDAQVDDYLKASGQIMHRWEEDVARFVLRHENMSTETWNDIYRAPVPRRRAEELGVCSDMTQPRLMAALQILMNIWEL